MFSPHALNAIPVITLGAGGPVELIKRAKARFVYLRERVYETYSRRLLTCSDWLNDYWLMRTKSPWAEEISDAAEHFGGPGCATLNLLLEWCCTAAACPDPDGGNRLLRTLDWPQHGLGRATVIAHHTSAAGAKAGDFYNITWPGFLGVLTAMAPRRFSVTLNQAPLPAYTGMKMPDWLLDRIRWWRADAIPPAFLLRQVCEECTSYSEAQAILSETPMATAALFTLSGIHKGESCVIERTADASCVHTRPQAAANHWLSMPARGHSRSNDSPQRHAAMRAVMMQTVNDFSWVRPPIINARTRLAVIMNAGSRYLRVQGYEQATDGALAVQPATFPYVQQMV